MGDRRKFLSEAISHIDSAFGEVLLKSEIYETEAWGYKSNNKYLNMAICISTELLPEALLDGLKKTERKMGRKESVGGYTDRPIDIDIIFYDDLVISTPEITIPHPHMESRRFVLEPLNDIAPEYIHPVLNKTVLKLLKNMG
jgi:2-amino-4-hydroxy-6-hydroxymethyldihydropteridine diphosphokinase